MKTLIETPACMSRAQEIAFKHSPDADAYRAALALIIIRQRETIDRLEGKLNCLSAAVKEHNQRQTSLGNCIILELCDAIGN